MVLGSEYLHTDRQQVGFKKQADHWFDVTQLLAGETEHYRGAFLENLYIRDASQFENWMLLERERLRQIYQVSLSEQLAAFAQIGKQEDVLDVGRQLIRLDDLREDWHYAMMLAFARLGNREAALAQYKLCALRLEQALGLSPNEQTEALYRQIQSGAIRENTLAARQQVNAETPPATWPEGISDDEIVAHAMHLLGSQATTREITHDVGFTKTIATILLPFIWSGTFLCFGPSSGISSLFFYRSSASVVCPKTTRI